GPGRARVPKSGQARSRLRLPPSAGTYWTGTPSVSSASGAMEGRRRRRLRPRRAPPRAVAAAACSAMLPSGAPVVAKRPAVAAPAPAPAPPPPPPGVVGVTGRVTGGGGHSPEAVEALVTVEQPEA